MSDSDLFDRAAKLFEAACDLPDDERARYLDQHCADQPELRREVESLLGHDVAADDRGNRIGACAGADVLAQDLSVVDGNTPNALQPAFPKSIGNYRILRVLGEGGMGVVYEAEQDAPKRLVALKVIRGNTISPKLVRRFQHEAFVLGQLRHPGIAHIYESGVVTVNGQSQHYFAMELVQGERIHQFARSHGHTIRQKLELMARVCDAVQHAHQKGIIHRDLKPANIIVVEQATDTTLQKDTMQSGTIFDVIGQPKVLDFGIARLTDPEAQAATMQTDIGQLVGTLPYMSPEQVEGDSQRLDTRSDIYALGAILYQLLSEQMPLDISGKSVAEAARIIRDDEPKTLGAIVPNAAGDIETIVSKAIEKEPDRRYHSAAELASDLRRFLTDQPIAARPATIGYQFRKFTRRNRVLVGGIATTFLALLIGLIGTGFFLSEAIRQRNTAEQERARTAAVADFQAELLEGINPRKFGRNLKKDLRAEYRRALEKTDMDDVSKDNEMASLKKILRRINGTNLARSILSGALIEGALDRIENGVSEDAITESRLRYAVGGMYERLGLYDEATEQFEETISLRRKHLTPDHPETLDAMNRAGLTYRKMGRVAEAETLLRETLARRREIHGDDHEESVRSLANLGALLRFKGDLEAARPLLLESMRETESLFGTEDKRSLSRRNTYCVLLMELGELEEALSCLRDVLETRERVSGSDNKHTISARNNLMATLFKSSQLAEAEPVARDVLASSLRKHGDDHPTSSMARNNLGMVLLHLNRVEEAEGLFRIAHDTSRQHLNPEHEVSMKSTGNLIDALLVLGHTEEAELLCRELIDVRRRLDPPQPGLIAQTLENFGNSLFQQQRFAEARDAWQECVDLRTGISSSHWLTQRARSRLGEAQTELKEFESAETIAAGKSRSPFCTTRRHSSDCWRGVH